MHELSLTVDMIAAVEEKMLTLPGKRLRRIVLEIGRASAVMPEAIKFAFETCTVGGDLEGTHLEIVEQAGQSLRIKHLEVE